MLTVVGYAGSVVRDEDAWVTPGQVAALRPRAAPGSVQMLYTFGSAGTSGQISADLAAVQAAATGRGGHRLGVLAAVGRTRPARNSRSTRRSWSRSR